MIRSVPRALALLLLVPVGVSAQNGRRGGGPDRPVGTSEVSNPGDASLGRLAKEIERLAPLSGGTMGVAAVHLETGRAVYLNADDHFPMASAYKVPIAVQLLTRVDRGEISLSDMVELEPEDLHPGSGTLTSLFDDPGVILSLRNIMELMLLISDNSAADLSLRYAGGGDVVTDRMRALGVDGIRVDRPTSLLIGDYDGFVDAPEDGRISPEMWDTLRAHTTPEQRQMGRETWVADPRDTATPRAMAQLLQMIWDGEALSPESTEYLLDVMLRVRTGAGRIKGMLTRDIDVAHKTGTLGPSTVDVGIIYLPNDAGHVVTAVFVKDSDAPGERREDAIAQISRAIYDFYLFNPGRMTG